MGAMAVTESRRQRKKDLVYIHGGKCAICGYDRCVWALCFHHIDPNTKDFNISNSHCRSIEKDIIESKKCILICQNCHSEIHSGLVKKNLETSFNEERAIEIIEKATIKNHRCKQCGSGISNKATYCKFCWSIINRKTKRPSRSELKQMIKVMPFTIIGEKYGVNDNTIRKWCSVYKLPKRKIDINSYTEEEWEHV